MLIIKWKYENGEFAEERSTEHGVAGFFLFRNKSVIADVPESGELVRWMRDKKLIFDEVSLAVEDWGLTPLFWSKSLFLAYVFLRFYFYTVLVLSFLKGKCNILLIKLKG